MHADFSCADNTDSLQRHGATVTPDNLLHLFRRWRPCNLKPVGRYRRADPFRVDELRALHLRAARSPKDTSAAPKDSDGEIRGSRCSPIRMRDMDPP